MDAWGIDVAMSGSQKGLMTPPGLGFVAAGERAREVHKTAGLRTPYWDWTEREGTEHYRKYSGTAPVHLLFALRKAIDMLFDEQLENVFLRHRLLAEAGDSVRYTYDFGDGWEHGIVLEKGLPVDPNMTYPLCMGGAGACPPEDCGGIGEFYNLLEASRNPRHPPARFFLPCSIRLIDSMENFLARFRSTLGENGPPKMRVRERIASSHMEDLAITVAAGDTAFP